jgi:hydrogenase small subunit
MMTRRQPTVAEEMAARGVSRRAFLKFGACIGSLLGLGSEAALALGEAIAQARRRSVIWLSFQECTGCTESLTRAHSPTLEELIFDFISLDYHHTLQAVSGAAAEEARLASMKENAGQYLLIVDGSVSTRDGGVYSTIAGITNLQMLEETAKDAFAIIALGSCAAFGGLPYANPNPTGAAPVSALVSGKPLVNVSGCPPVPTVITGVLAYILAFGKLPELDHLGRPLAFFGETIHDRCYRRPFYDRGLFADSFDDEGARKGYCLYKVGCKGPVAYNACATQKWNGGTSFPIQSGHGCFGCSEPSFWDREGGLYGPLPSGQLGDAKTALVAAAVGLGLGAASASLGRQRQQAADADVLRPRKDET